jgi:hypothetical protein
MRAAQSGPDQVTLAWDSIPGTMEYRIYLGAMGATEITLLWSPVPDAARRLDLRFEASAVDAVAS